MSRRFDEKLIEAVRANQLLYNPCDKDYHDPIMKDNAWEEIASTTNTSAGYCKKKWSGIRDNYRKAMRKRESATQAKPYKYQDILSFLDPFISGRHHSNIVLEENSPEEGMCELLPVEEMTEVSGLVSTDGESVQEEHSPLPAIGHKQRQQIATVLQNYLHKKCERQDKPKDHLTKFFESMEATVRTFTPMLQVEVKSKISAMVMHYELQNLIAQNSPNQPGAS